MSARVSSNLDMISTRRGTLWAWLTICTVEFRVDLFLRRRCEVDAECVGVSRLPERVVFGCESGIERGVRCDRGRRVDGDERLYERDRQGKSDEDWY